MCRRATCQDCGRPTFAGCGAHVESVLADVPRDERCRCREKAAESADGAAAQGTQPKGWLDSLFGTKK